MKKLLAVVVCAPILAMFVGMGVLAYNVAQTWDQRNTDVLLSGLVTSCLAGAIVISLILSCFIALVWYARWQRDQSWSLPSQHYPQLPRQSDTFWTQPPPSIEMKADDVGSWDSSGPGAYDTIGDTFSPEEPWS